MSAYSVYANNAITTHVSRNISDRIALRHAKRPGISAVPAQE
jgi:hypothetical protein